MKAKEIWEKERPWGYKTLSEKLCEYANNLETENEGLRELARLLSQYANKFDFECDGSSADEKRVIELWAKHITKYEGLKIKEERGMG